MSAYTPVKYIDLQDALDHLGWDKTQINTIDDKTKNRYQNWAREGNNLVENIVFEFGDDVPLLPTSKEYNTARSAALNWVVYKSRDKEGSRNAVNAKNDHFADLEAIKRMLTATRTTRTKTASIPGVSRKNGNILLPSQIDTRFY